MKQLAGGGQRIGRQYFAIAMHRQITEILNELGFGEQRITDHLPKTGFMNQGAKMILIRQSNCRIVFIQPRHRHFQSPTGIKARRSRIGVRHGFRFDGGLKQHRPFGFEKLEMWGSHGFSIE